MRSILLVLATLCTTGVALGQSPAGIDYTLTIDSADLSSFAVTMRIFEAPPRFVVAAHAHPEYDDKYWRFLREMAVHGAEIERLDSVRWQVSNARGPVTLSYRVAAPLAPAPRAAWRAFLTPIGGVTGGPHAFLYVIGAEQARATVRTLLPTGWMTVSGMVRDSIGRFVAPDIFTLMESPLMVGRLSAWRFHVANVPHHVYYLPGANPTTFDSTAFVDGVKRIVEQSYAVFGMLPYQQYAFMIADDAYGGLEHPNSATMGVESAELARNPYATTEEIAHEFFHTWNLMRMRPAEYRGVDYRVQPPTAGLWFSEGTAMFYADLLRRRAGFIMPEPTRLHHLQNLLTRYADHPAYDQLSAEEISRAEYNSSPGVFGNLDPGTHLIGEVVGSMIDFIVRDATNGRRSMDDVMRLMDERFRSRGFTGRDIERAVADVCACSVTSFFDAHVRGGSRIDINRDLAPFGLRQVVTRVPARNQAGELERDFRIRAWAPTPQDTLRLLLFTTDAIWSRAGMRTNDRVLSVNGVAVKTWPEFRAQITAVPIGGNVRFELMRPNEPVTVDVTMAGYDRTVLRLEELPHQTERQRRLRAQWLAGRPDQPPPP